MSYKGADYRKADLQLHSPRDSQWKGGRPDEKLLEGASADEIAAVRRQWASDFVDACIAKGVQVASLTDHHEGVYCWYVLAEVEERKAQQEVDFWFMPGMELTCKDSAQVLILFDWNLSRVLFDKVRNKLGMKADVNESKKTGVEVELLEANFNDLQSLLEADFELRGKFTIMPNITPGGHKTVLRDGFHKRFKEMPYRGGYLDKMTPDKIPEGDRRALNGEIPAWSDKVISIISTSDARTADFTNIGKYATWLKMAVPTAESLRQAMLAAGSRILYQEPTVPDLYIKSVTVTDATFLALGQHIEFSPQLTAVIGGRGSGKSTLLEYVRYALGISALDVDEEEWNPTFSRRQKLLKSTLSNTTSKVEIELIQQGVLIHLVRNGAGSDRIYMQVAGKSRPLSIAEVRETFPVQAYSQGELSHLGDTTADSRLFELITTSHREELNAVEDDIKRTAGELRKQLEQNVEHWRLEGELRKIDTQLATTAAGITNAKQGLGGLKQETQTVLNQHQEVATTSRWIEQLTTDYQNTYTILVSAYDEHIRLSERHLKAEDVPADEAAQALATALREHLDTVSESYLKVLTARQDFERQQTSAGQIWATHKASHNSAYEKAIEESSQYSSKLALLNKLEEQQAIELRKRDDIIRKMEPLQESLTNLRKTGALYISHQHELRRLSQLSADQLAGLTNNQARAELAETDDTSKMVQGIKDLFYQSNVREFRLEKLLSIITTQDTLGTWWKFLEEILAILRWKITGLHETDQRPQLPILDPTIEGGLQKFGEILTINRVSQILTVIVRPRMQLLQNRGSYETAFSEASQGEKATILLNVLMRQPGGPLLLDQPEEDLDNRIIGDIVKATQDAKNKKQLLFATHNANLVVNGDAELVVNLENGRVLQIGAIDLEPLRDSITETMEGGKEAFELRRHKYNF